MYFLFQSCSCAYFKRTIISFIFLVILLTSCTQEQFFIDTKVQEIIMRDTTDDFIIHCPLRDCDVVFATTRRKYQELANQQQRDLFIPVECCFEGNMHYGIVKVSPTVISDNNLLER